jgi:polysaccharide export outer membrane protein
MTRRSRNALLVMLATLLAAGPVSAQVRVAPPPAAVPTSGIQNAEYVLGAEDEISISVWLHPELERKVAIGVNGSVVLPPIGEVQAAGLTTKQLGERLSERMSTYLRQTTTVTVSISRYLSRSVTVTGAVNGPGRYGFERIPSLLEVLNAAGGAVPGADLTRVQIVRREGEGKGTTSVDVQSIQRTGNSESLPQLKPGDTIVVQSFAGAYAPAPGDGFAVIGEVTRPGIYQAGQASNIWMALAQAGGLTQVGDLGRVKIVTITPEGQQVTELNLKAVLKQGGPSVTLVKPGDIVYVPHTVSSVAAKGWVGLTQTLALTADIVNIVIIADYLNRQ